eukprot:COSAG02_NODE_35280_length_471_cov_0.693548_2_plen_83_part_01
MYVMHNVNEIRNALRTHAAIDTATSRLIAPFLLAMADEYVGQTTSLLLSTLPVHIISETGTTSAATDAAVTADVVWAPAMAIP